MRLPQRFERLPSEEARDGQDIQLSEYPPDTKMNTKEHVKGNVGHDYQSVPIETGYNAAAYHAHNKDASQPSRIIDRIEAAEKTKFGTRYFNQFHALFLGGWRGGLLRSFVFSFVALVANFAIYGWLFGTYNTKMGTAVIRTGSCRSIRWDNTAIHAALNIVSTLILGASTYAMQGMTAPTRPDVDRAHAKGRWLEIGTQSLRNLPFVRKSNTWTWLLLGITSLPYHLFFNAVFFTTTHGNQYAVAIIDKSILSASNFEPTKENASPDLFPQFIYHSDKCLDGNCYFDNKNETIVFGLLRDVINSSDKGIPPGFVRMSSDQCIQNYATGFMRQYSDIALVAKQNRAGSTVLWAQYPQRLIIPDSKLTNQDPFHWICSDLIVGTEGDRNSALCGRDLALDKTGNGRNWTVHGNAIDYCLARTMPDTCNLQFNAYLMLGVVLFGVVKTIVIAVLVFTHRSEQTLHTLGDAIACYLKQPDSTTKNMCLVSSKQLRKHGWRPPYAPQVFTGYRPRWLTSANTTEFFSSIGISAFYILVLSIALFFGVRGARGFAFDSNLGAPDYQSLAYIKPDDIGSSGIVPTLLIANIPQLGFSILYVVYTSICGKLLVSHEFDRLTQSRKGLRVSERPMGMQRGSHFFTLPTRYALPLMACSTALHWLCSQSFFMVRIDGVDAQGKIDPHDRLVRLGYNSKGVILLISVSVAMLVGTVCIASWRRLNTSLGETSMSVIISASCHPERYVDGAWEMEVQWGDVSGASVDSRVSAGGLGVRHCGFSAEGVKRPVVGVEYS